jgi:hypothetical protein
MFIDNAKELALTLEGGQRMLLERLQYTGMAFRLGDAEAESLKTIKLGWMEAHSDPATFQELNEALVACYDDTLLDRRLHELYLGMAAWMDNRELAAREISLRVDLDARLLSSRAKLGDTGLSQHDLARIFRDTHLAEERQAAWQARRDAVQPLAENLLAVWQLEDERARIAGYSSAIERELSLAGLEFAEWRRWFDLCWQAALDLIPARIAARNRVIQASQSGSSSSAARFGALWPMLDHSAFNGKNPEELFRDTCELLALDAGTVPDRLRCDLHDLDSALQGLLPSPEGEAPFALMHIHPDLAGVTQYMHLAARALSRTLALDSLPLPLRKPLPLIEAAMGGVFRRLSLTPHWVMRLLEKSQDEELAQTLMDHELQGLARLLFALKLRLDHAKDPLAGWQEWRHVLLGEAASGEDGLDLLLEPLSFARAADLVRMAGGEMLAAQLMATQRQRHGEDLLAPEFGGLLLSLMRAGSLLPIEDLLEQAGQPALDPRALLAELGVQPSQELPPMPDEEELA